MKLLNVAFRFILILGFLLVTLVVVAEARGWRFNRRTWRLERTGTLVVRFQPEDATLSVNRRTIPKKSPIVVDRLIPGRYESTLAKAGYQSWTSTFTIEPERVVAEIDVVLFRREPIIERVTDANELRRYQEERNRTSDRAIDPLVMNGSEIWIDKTLITRVTEPVLHVRWLIERDYIIFQTGQEFRVVRIDGTNDVVVVRLERAGVSVPVPNRKGSELLFEDGTVVKRAVIR